MNEQQFNIFLVFIVFVFTIFLICICKPKTKFRKRCNIKEKFSATFDNRLTIDKSNSTESNSEMITLKAKSGQLPYINFLDSSGAQNGFLQMDSGSKLSGIQKINDVSG